VRTFERGIEAETFPCGTGAMASASVARRLGLAEEGCSVGGSLIIFFERDRAFMEGLAVTVYAGVLSEEFINEISLG
jgi:diaminopimelate epimerase